MKHIYLFFVALLAAVLPLAVQAQSEQLTIKSTFTGNVYGTAHETYSEGTLTTAEGKDWKWIGEGESKNPIIQMTEVGGQGCLSVKLRTSTFRMYSDYAVPGTIKEITFTGGGNIGMIQFGFGETSYRYNLSMPESGLLTFTFSYDGMELKSKNPSQEIYVTLFPKDESSSAPMYIQSITFETEVEKTGDNDIVSVFEHYDSYTHLLVANDGTHNWKYALPADSTQAAVYDANFDGTPCILMRLTGGTSTYPRLTFYSDFPVVGKVKKIIVKAAGDIRCISYTKDDGETVDSQMASSTVPYLDDFVLDLGAGIQMNDILRFHLYAGRNLYLHSITIVMAGGQTEEVSFTSTLCDWETLDASGTYLIGEMKSLENNSWFTYINDIDASVYKTSIQFGGDASSAEECMVIVNPSDPKMVEIQLQNMFTVSGPVRKIIVSFTGQVEEMGASIVERGTWDNDQVKRTNTFQQGSGFTDVELTFNGAIEYTDADIRLYMVGTEPIFLKSITVVQEEGSSTGLPSGKCGNNLEYAITQLPYNIYVWDYETSQSVEAPAFKLTITGTGDMYDYGWDANKAPWMEEYQENIAEIELPEGLTRVGSEAFDGCNNARIDRLPSTLKSIGSYAFSSMYWFTPDLHLPEGLTTIESRAFIYSNGIQNLYLPSTVTRIGEGAIAALWDLENYYVDDANTTYKSDGNAVIETATGILVAGNKNTVIPNYVKVIDTNAFYGVHADEIAIPASVVKIGQYAFGNSHITKLNIPANVRVIGNYAFYSCGKLLNVTIGSGTKRFGTTPFYNSTNILDINCYARIDSLEWTQGTNESRSFKPDKMTKMHVRAADLSIYEESFGFLNVTFVGDLGSTIAPITEETSVAVSALQNEDLSDNTVDNIYYNLDASTGSGYKDGCLVIGQTTDMSLVSDGNPGSGDVRDNFTGIILEVGPGKGVITVNARSIGKTLLAVRIGDGTPTYAAHDERWNTYVSYDVTEPTYVYIYAVGNGAALLRRSTDSSDFSDLSDALLIYGITVSPGEDEIGIKTLTSTLPKGEEAIYNLAGQRISKTQKGIRIVNGKKILIK